MCKEKRMASASTKYQKFTQLEHILARPDTYVGSLERDVSKQWVLNADASAMEPRLLTHVPGLFKIYDEILVNAIDQTIVDSTVDAIKVHVDRESGTISVMNTGKGIPIVKHEKENMWIPEMIFGELLTSSNYDDSEKRTVGGRNGYGAKLANIFSVNFQVDIVDSETGQRYVQTFTDNMTNRSAPKITKKASKGYAKFTFVPDYKRFGMESLDNDTFAMLERRVYDACACTPDSVGVYFNGKKLCYKNFEKYVDLYIGGKKTTQRIYEGGHRWDVCVCHSDDGYKQVSFVNGINTSVGGTHVEHVVKQMIQRITEKILIKNPQSQVKSTFIRDHMFVFVKAILENPTFSSQTKTECTSKVTSFGSRFTCSEDFTKRLLKLGIMDDAVALAKHKEFRELSKTDGRKKVTIKGIPKLDDANKAGTAQSSQCTLILTEGDSAKTFAISGLSVVGRDHYGVFPLRGKLLNVREASPKQLMDNAEINALKQILGLQQGKEYTKATCKELRYGRVLILTDADVDGSHIKGLIINFFHYFWPSLLDTGFEVAAMITPVMKAVRGSEQHSFYNLNEFKEWAAQQADGGARFAIKYYKGLGTSTATEAKEYFRNMQHNVVSYFTDPTTDECVTLAFKKDKADLRKQWILGGIESGSSIDYSCNVKKVTYNDFVNKDLIWFSIADLERSIPSAIDGLKPSQRKVLYACRKRKNTDTKVSQLAGYVSTESAYHHGEQSMMGTIISLAQNFVGSNTYNLLEPVGQFGTRLMGGKDAASPRYIFTKLSAHAQQLFHQDDDSVLEYLQDDGIDIEPKHYVPVLPLVLINGAEGIGTGYSCSVPCFNPEEVQQNVSACVEGGAMKELTPWYQGFTGEITKVGDGAFVTKGRYTIKSNTTVEITELPIGRWTQDYKEFLDNVIDTKITGYTNHSSETHVLFTVKFDALVLKKLLDNGTFEKEFRLTTNLSTRNMHLFDSAGCIRKYNDPNDIIREYVGVRLEFYKRRKAHLEKVLGHKLTVLSNKKRFVEMVIQEKLVIFRKKSDVLVSELKYLKFDTIDKSYNYLLHMKIDSLTEERIVALEREHSAATKELAGLTKTHPQSMWSRDLKN